MNRDQQPVVAHMVDKVMAESIEKSSDSFMAHLESMRTAAWSSIVEQAELPFISDRLLSYTHEVTKPVRQEMILNKLHFPAMESRKLGIPDAHHNTFEWALGPNTEENLVTWLREGEGVFWISGKPGSGKSTLVKHIHGTAATQDHLRNWTGKCRLVVAGFFFWSSGTRMQNLSKVSSVPYY